MRAPAGGLAHGGRRHGVAIDQEGDAETLARLLQQIGKRGVEGPIEPLDALESGADGQSLAIDLLGVGDDAGDGAEPAHHAGRLGVGELGHPAGEELGVELVGLAVDVQIGAREACGDQRRTQGHDGLEQLVDVAVFGFAQGMRIEPGGLQEGLGIDAAGMGRAEHDGGQLLVGPQQSVGRVQLCEDGSAFTGVHIDPGLVLERCGTEAGYEQIQTGRNPVLRSSSATTLPRREQPVHKRGAACGA